MPQTPLREVDPMKLKMSPNSLFAILLRNPWWISIGLVGVVSLASRALLPEQYVVFGMMGGFPFLVIGIIAAWRQWQAPNPQHLVDALAKAGAMSWADFSDLIDKAFTRNGYAVTRLKSGAADFSLEKRGQTTLLNARRWKAANQGVEALRELAAQREKQGADQCIFVSLAQPTDTALRFAKDNCVQIICDADLAKLIA